MTERRDDYLDDEPDEKPKRTPYYGPENTPCPICGEVNYEWGKMGSQGGLYYLPEGAWFGFGMGEPLRARKCLRCGNVQVFLK